MRLEGKVAIVTGASRGIGKGIAQWLAQEGARVAMTARGAEGLQDAAAGIQASGGTEKLVGETRTAIIGDVMGKHLPIAADRRKGLGSKLLAGAAKEAEALQASRMYLEVRESNEAAIPALEALIEARS